MNARVQSLGLGAVLAALAPGLAAAAEPGEAAGGHGKFATPVWDAGARWQMEKFASCGVAGHLDGPRLELQYYSAGYMGRLYRPKGAGRYALSSYDPATERAHVVGGWARGYLDGPLSRARLGGWDYVVHSAGATSPDGRFWYFTDGYNGHVLRCVDLEKQEVRTLLPDAKGLMGLVADGAGRLYALKPDGQFLIVMPDGSTEPGPKAQLGEDPGNWGASLALDEKNGRIYATCYAAKDYYVWYWDRKDGSFHGVLPTPAKSGLDRGRNKPGPFEGVNLYNQGSLCFGPDDPEYRYLYTGRTDTWGWFRMDLVKRTIAALDIESGGKGKPAIVRFSDERFSKVNVYGAAGWMEDGSFVSTVHSPYDTWRFLRVR
jgi:hypothetical protein